MAGEWRQPAIILSSRPRIGQHFAPAHLLAHLHRLLLDQTGYPRMDSVANPLRPRRDQTRVKHFARAARKGASNLLEQLDHRPAE